MCNREDAVKRKHKEILFERGGKNFYLLWRSLDEFLENKEKRLKYTSLNRHN